MRWRLYGERSKSVKGVGGCCRRSSRFTDFSNNNGLVPKLRNAPFDVRPTQRMTADEMIAIGTVLTYGPGLERRPMGESS